MRATYYCPAALYKKVRREFYILPNCQKPSSVRVVAHSDAKANANGYASSMPTLFKYAAPASQFRSFFHCTMLQLSNALFVYCTSCGNDNLYAIDQQFVKPLNLFQVDSADVSDQSHSDLNNA